MPMLVSVLVGFSALLCLVRPAWGFLAYLATTIIRPNEMMPDMLLPAAPVMIIAAALGYTINHSRAMPRIGDGQRSLGLRLMVAMLAMLLAHMVLLHRDLLVDWLLNDVSQFTLMLLYLRSFFSSPERLSTQLGGIMTGGGFIALLPLPIHFLFKGPRRLTFNNTRLPYPSYGKLWDMYHLEGSRLQGQAGTLWANPNYLGIAANWAVPGALYNLRKKGGKITKPFYLALFTGLVTTLILTGSRAGQLQLGIILWMVLVGGKRKALGIVLLLVTMVGLIFVLPRLEPQRADANASSAERSWVLSAGVAMFKSAPIFGVGFENYRESSPRRLHAHNVYMQSLAETGLVGFALFMTFMVFLRRETAAAVRFFESGPDPNTALAARCIGAMQFGFTVYAFFSNVFMNFLFAIPMTTAVGLHLCMRRQMALKAKSKPEVTSAGEVEAQAELVASAECVRPADVRRQRLGRPAPAPAVLAPHAEEHGEFEPALPEAGGRQLGPGGDPPAESEPGGRRGPR